MQTQGATLYFNDMHIINNHLCKSYNKHMLERSYPPWWDQHVSLLCKTAACKWLIESLYCLCHWLIESDWDAISKNADCETSELQMAHVLVGNCATPAAGCVCIYIYIWIHPSGLCPDHRGQHAALLLDVCQHAALHKDVFARIMSIAGTIMTLPS